MLDLINLNVGSSGRVGQKAGISGTISSGARAVQVNVPTPPDSDNVKYAKKIIRIFDVASIDYYRVSDALWNLASDAVKRHLYGMADALMDVAADKHEKDLCYTLVEREIGTNAAVLRRFLKSSGYLTPDP